MLYNVGLISQDAEDVASENPENQRFRLLHCCLTPHSREPCTANVRINFILPATRVIGIHFRRW